jgi:pimeloyl-ACP methyl ester carboxylesterase
LRKSGTCEEKSDGQRLNRSDSFTQFPVQLLVEAGSQMNSEVRLDFADLVGETRWLGDFMSWTLDGLFHRTTPNARVQRRGVLLIPGFLSGDYSLRPIADRLETLGYRTFFSGIWYNVECPVHTLPRLEKVLRKANYKTQSKLVLIGHSLGGIYARELACRFPNLVERAILLGSPVRDLRNFLTR